MKPRNIGRVVTVCAECLTASCWHGDMKCEKSRRAGTINVPVRRLNELRREHPDNYSEEKIRRVCGEEP